MHINKASHRIHYLVNGHSASDVDGLMWFPISGKDGTAHCNMVSDVYSVPASGRLPLFSEKMEKPLDI